MNNHYPFLLKPLPYAYNALEPYIDEETVTIHHDKHLQTYVDNLNKALENYPQYHDWSLRKLVTDFDYMPFQIQTAVKNNAGGVFNHNLYFDLMTPNSSKKPLENVSKAIDNSFESYDEFVKALTQAALGQFGSGWAWLVTDNSGNVKIVSTPNQDTPLTSNLYPILLVDVWEHAYYLKYKNKRVDYVNNWFNLINWQAVEERYNNRNKFFES